MVPLFLGYVIFICSFFIWIFPFVRKPWQIFVIPWKDFFFFETWNVEFETWNFETWNFENWNFGILKIKTWDLEIWNMEFEIWKIATWNFKIWDFENFQFEILKCETWDWIWNLECGILSLGMKILNWKFGIRDLKIWNLKVNLLSLICSKNFLFSLSFFFFFLETNMTLLFSWFFLNEEKEKEKEFFF